MLLSVIGVSNASATLDQYISESDCIRLSGTWSQYNGVSNGTEPVSGYFCDLSNIFNKRTTTGLTQNDCRAVGGHYEYYNNPPTCKCGDDSGAHPMIWTGSKCDYVPDEILCAYSGIWNGAQCICPMGIWFEHYGCESIKYSTPNPFWYFLRT